MPPNRQNIESHQTLNQNLGEVGSSLPLQCLFTNKELAEHLIRIKGFHEGLYDLSIEFSFAVGNIGPTKEQMLPGAMFGVSGVGLIKTEQVGPNTVDAALVNPTKPSRKKKKDTP